MSRKREVGGKRSGGSRRGRKLKAILSLTCEKPREMVLERDSLRERERVGGDAHHLNPLKIKVRLTHLKIKVNNKIGENK